MDDFHVVEHVILIKTREFVFKAEEGGDGKGS
jgi:hypothetical protein